MKVVENREKYKKRNKMGEKMYFFKLLFFNFFKIFFILIFFFIILIFFGIFMFFFVNGKVFFLEVWFLMSLIMD